MCVSPRWRRKLSTSMKMLSTLSVNLKVRSINFMLNFLTPLIHPEAVLRRVGTSSGFSFRRKNSRNPIGNGCRSHKTRTNTSLSTGTSGSTPRTRSMNKRESSDKNKWSQWKATLVWTNIPLPMNLRSSKNNHNQMKNNNRKESSKDKRVNKNEIVCISA